MKKLFIIIVLGLSFSYSYAGLRIPNLVSPVNEALNGMPYQRLGWDAVPSIEEVTYIVDLSENDDFAVKSTYHTNIPEIYIRNLVYGKKYYWRVKAESSVASSEYSTTFSFTVISKIQISQPLSKNKSTIETSISIGANYIDKNKTFVLAGVNGFEYILSEDPEFNDPDVTVSDVIKEADAYKIYNSKNELQEYKLGSYKLKYATTPYYLKVRAYSIDGENYVYSDWNILKFQMAVSPELNKPNDDEPYDMVSNFRWRTITGSSEYVLEISEYQDFSVKTVIVNTPTNQIKPSGIGFGKKYYWRVKAVSEDSESEYSEVWTFTTEDKGISIISPADGITQANNPVYFTFNKILGVDGYVLEFYDPNSSGNPKPVIDRTVYRQSNDSVSNLEKTVTITKYLEFDKEIEWTIKSFLRSDTMKKSTPRTITVSFHTPTLLSPVNNTSINNFALVKWSTLLGVTGYEIEFADDVYFTKNKNIIEVNDPLQTEINVLFLAGQDFFIRMRAIAGSKYSDYSEVRKFHTDISQPQLISPLHKYEGNPLLVTSPVTFEWSPVYGVNEYDVEYSRDVNFEDVTDIVKISPELINSGYTQPVEIPLGVYYWRVRGQRTWGLTHNDGSPVIDNAGYQRDSTYYSIYSLVGNFKVVNEIGIDNIEELSLRVYPNPCEDKLIIDNLDNLADEQLFVTDVTGKRVLSINTNDLNSDGRIELNVSSLKPGIYFISLENEYNIRMSKFIKK